MTKHGQTAHHLDNLFVQTLQQIEGKFIFLGKHVQIRIQKWVAKLLKNDENIVWKKSRNNYLLLLNFMIDQQCIQTPFDKIPGASSLPNLTDYELTQRTQGAIKHNHDRNSLWKVEQVSALQGDQEIMLTPNYTEREHQHKNDIDATLSASKEAINLKVHGKGDGKDGNLEDGHIEDIEQMDIRISEKNADSKKRKPSRSLIRKLLNVFVENQQTLQKDEEYQPILRTLNRCLNGDSLFSKESVVPPQRKNEENLNPKSEQQTRNFQKWRGTEGSRLRRITLVSKPKNSCEDIEFKVEEGIEIDKIGMFSFLRSPRTHFAQIQYFQEALRE